jgi:hypothetical protein
VYSYHFYDSHHSDSLVAIPFFSIHQHAILDSLLPITIRLSFDSWKEAIKISGRIFITWRLGDDECTKWDRLC